jgi:raffinose/stachyose/melibiose transport system substrate-binding protein
MGSDADHQATDWGLVLATSMTAPADAIRNTYLAKSDGGWSPDDMKRGVAMLQSWGKKGYFADGYRGLQSDAAAARFSKGQGLFFVNGTWWASGVGQGLGSAGRFMTAPVGPSGKPAQIAAPNQPWMIPTKSKNKLAAALYINFITDPANAGVFLKYTDIPASTFDASQGSKQPIAQDILKAADTIKSAGTGLPFQWIVPNMMQYIEGPGIGLLPGKVSVDDFVKNADAALKQDQEAASS